MPQPSEATLLRHLRRLAAEQHSSSEPDQKLLQQFLAGTPASEAAFAALVGRHGSMVLGVCRSVLGHHQDAEDAFQATFLVLARRAGAIRTQASVGSWLHGVAYRLAQRAKRQAAQRRARQTLAAPPPVTGPVEELSVREWQAILHEELQRLPQKYRAALLLCYWEGKTRDEAAEQLGERRGTLREHLELARKLLRSRLTRRGLTPSVALFATLFASRAAEAVVLTLATATVKAALACTGQTGIAGPVPARALALAEGATRAMRSNRGALAALVLLLLSSLAGGLGLLAITPGSIADRQKTRGQKPRTDAQGDPLPRGAVARLGTLRLRDGTGVSFLAFTADGRTIAYAGSGGVDNVLRLADARTGKDVKTFAFEPSLLLERMALSSDGKWLAASFVNPYQARQPPIVVWDTTTGKRRCRIPRSGWGMTFSPDGKVLVTGGQIWDTATGKKRHDLARGVAPAFSADGKLLAVADDDGSVFLYETAGWRKVCSMKAAPAGKKIPPGASRPALAFSPNGKWLVAVTSDGGLRIWEPATGDMIAFLSGRRGDACSLSISPDSKLLAVASAYSASNRTTIWDLTTRKLLHEIDAARVVAFSPSAVRPALLATGGGAAAGSTFGCAPAVRYWDPLIAREITINDAPYGAVQLTRWLPGGKLLAVSPAEKVYRVWDWRLGKQLSRVSTGDKYIAWAVDSPDGKLLAVSHWRGFQGEDDTIHLFDLQTGKETRQFGRNESNYPVGFTSGSRFLVTSAPLNRLAIWDTATGKPARRLDLKKELKGGVNRVAVSVDGKSLVLEMAVRVPPPPGSEDPGGSLIFKYSWCGVELRTGKFGGTRSAQRWCADGVTPSDALAISPDGKVAACGIPGKIQLRDVATGACLREFSSRDERVPWNRQAGALAFTRDGKRLIAADGRTNVFVWDVATGKQLHKFTGHRGRIFSVSASPDGTMLATASEDSTVMLWRLDPR